MIDKYDQLYKDFVAVQQIPIVETMLEVVCRLTGMGFTAIARVTEERWLACSVRDNIAFGLKAGDELEIKSTICNEIRDNSQPVIIDHVQMDEYYKNHHTPKLYGFQSYISYPIIQQEGQFFGTLCAIDPKPVPLHDPAIMGTFKMFAELLAFHLQSIDLINKSQAALKEAERELNYSLDEIRQYQHISTHTLREPLRKIGLFSDLLVHHTEAEDVANARQTAVKLQSFAGQLSRQIQDITKFSAIESAHTSFEFVDLNIIFAEVCLQLSAEIQETGADIRQQALPALRAIPGQMGVLFFHLLRNAIYFSRPGVPPVIEVTSNILSRQDVPEGLAEGQYHQIMISDNGRGIESYRLQRIFDVFEKFDTSSSIKGSGAGLSYCRKIVHQHGGQLSAQSNIGAGTTFTIILPG